MNRDKIVYLSGAMLGCTDAECKDWREYAKRRLKCETRDPVVLRDFRGREQEGIVEVVERDKADIDDCAIVLVNFIKPSVGTSMEILYAWERGKTVVLVAPQNSIISPWLLYHSHKVFFTLEDAIASINEMVCGAPGNKPVTEIDLVHFFAESKCDSRCVGNPYKILLVGSKALIYDPVLFAASSLGFSLFLLCIRSGCQRLNISSWTRFTKSK